MRKGALQSIELLHDWFMQNKRPYWTLYRSFQMSKRNPGQRIISNVDISDMEESWDHLADMIARHSSGGGDFTIAVADNPQINNAFQTLLALGGPGAYSGIGGFNSGYGYGGGAGVGLVPEGEIERRIQAALETERLRRDVEDLQEALDASESGGAIGKVMELLKDSPQLQSAAIGFISKFAGMMDPPAAPTNIPAGASGVNGQGANVPNEAEIQQIQQSLVKLGSVFGDVGPFLSALADYAASNPGMAQSLFDNIKKKEDVG